MSTHLKKRQEKLLQILSAIAEESAKGTPIIVEGKKDAEALHTLGVEGNVITAKTGGKTFLDVVSKIEQLRASKAVLLLDFDRRGKQGTQRLKQSLEHTKIRPNTTFWRELSALVGREIQCVESLTAYLRNLNTKIAASAN